MRTLLEYAQKYEDLLSEQHQLNEENDRLTRYIEATDHRIRIERQKVERAITENGVYLLKHDQDRQAEFRNATDIHLTLSRTWPTSPTSISSSPPRRSST